ncbi:MAG: glycosyltransferase, partial [Candidatus Promineifilaceae bacterium]|nr:glycosyltransferase [Candidatus Promineifilaceae bacterium]
SSLVLDEAFAVKVPVVASRIGVMIEKIKDNINGRLFPVGDIDALTRLLSDLINQPDVLQQWQEGIPEVYRIEEHVRDIEKVYQEAVDAV